MNFQQLEYIIALAQEGHFAKAAQRCYVTQPTLSMMIRKLEEELGTMIFDRSEHPIRPTKPGQRIIEQAKIVLNQKELMLEIIREEKNTLEGELVIGIIPTLAPYLLPLFIDGFTNKYPDIQLRIVEANTEYIVRGLQRGEFDLGLLATPLKLDNINEYPLFYERFFLYSTQLQAKEYIAPEEIDPDRLILLEEGHCLRSQVMNLCELKEKNDNFTFRTGSLETLKKLVEQNQGTTILPELAVRDLNRKQKAYITPFTSPEPVREISIITHGSFIKSNMLRHLKAEILSAVPRELLKNPNDNRIAIEI